MPTSDISPPPQYLLLRYSTMKVGFIPFGMCDVNTARIWTWFFPILFSALGTMPCTYTFYIFIYLNICLSLRTKYLFIFAMLIQCEKVYIRIKSQNKGIHFIEIIFCLLVSSKVTTVGRFFLVKEIFNSFLSNQKTNSYNKNMHCVNCHFAQCIVKLALYWVNQSLIVGSRMV